MPDELPGVSRLELRDYLDVLRRRKWIVVVTVIVLVVTAVGLSRSKPPVYTATAQFILQPNSDEPPALQMSNEPRVIESAAVKAIVLKKLPNAGDVSAAPSGPGTTIMNVSASAGDPESAALVANTYVASYIEYRRGQDVASSAAAREQIQARTEEIRRLLDDTINKMTAEQRRVSLSDPNSANELRTISDKYQPFISSYSTQQSVLQQQLGDLAARQTNPAGVAEILTPASPPGLPSSPLPRRDGTMALGAGLMLGIALAFVFEFLDNTIRARSDVEETTGPAVPVLGVIPNTKGWGSRRSPDVVSLLSTDARATEAYRTLAANMQFLTANDDGVCAMFTSPSANEGKSTTVANLAVALARAGRDVVVVDGDMRRPSIHAMFNLSNDVGLSSAMLADAADVAMVEPVLQNVAGVDRLRVLTAGPIPPYPVELLSSPRFQALLESLKANRTIVLVDSPPILPFADAVVIGRLVDTAVLVVAAGKCTRKQLKSSLQNLARLSISHIATVLNRSSEADLPGSGYRYEIGRRKGRHSARSDAKREDIRV